jgi:hypothetical protein
MTHGSFRDSQKSVSGITYISVILDTEFGFFLDAARPQDRGSGKWIGPTAFQSVTGVPCAGPNKPATRRGGTECPGE